MSWQYCTHVKTVQNVLYSCTDPQYRPMSCIPVVVQYGIFFTKV